MMKTKHILRAAGVWILSASLISGTVHGAQTTPDMTSDTTSDTMSDATSDMTPDATSDMTPDGQTIDPGKILSGLFSEAQEEADQIVIPCFEGTVHVEAADGMRNAIADHYRSEDDMSWIEGADIFLQGMENETRGADLEASFFFNDRELYHLRASWDREENDLYLVCPELKEEVLLFPVGNFSADAQTLTGRKVTPEMIADYTTALKELNDLIKSISLEMLEAEFMKYAAVLDQYVTVDTGIMTIEAGSLSSEGHTTTWSLDREDYQEMIPRALELLSKDALLQQILESPFAEHVFRLFVPNKALKLLPKGALWPLASNALTTASLREYDWNRQLFVTLALDRNGKPIHLSASLEQNGMQAELFRITALSDGADHALEVKVGPALAKAAGFKVKMPCGISVHGSLKDDILRESVNVEVNGVTMPLIRIQGMDLLEIENAWLSGIFSLSLKNLDYSCDFYTGEDGLRSMDFAVNGTKWFTLTADFETVESTSLDELDTQDAFRVDSRKAFFKYIRDAFAIRMFEKLSSAGVPQEYVDMLTDGEAATESSRENTEELG